jgi:regulator of replication initiation timing
MMNTSSNVAAQLATREVRGETPLIAKKMQELQDTVEDMKKQLEAKQKQVRDLHRQAQGVVDECVRECVALQKENSNYKRLASDTSNMRREMEIIRLHRRLIDVMSRVNESNIKLTVQEFRAAIAACRLANKLDPRVGHSTECECLIKKHNEQESLGLAYRRGDDYWLEDTDYFRFCGNNGSVNCDICNRKLCSKHALTADLTESCYEELGIPETAMVCTLCWTPDFFAGEAVSVEDSDLVSLDDIVEGRAKKARFDF